MSKKVTSINLPLQASLLRITKIHYFFAALLAFQVIIYDAWKLLAPEAVLQRWTAVGFLLILVTIVWYLLQTKKSLSHVQVQLLAFILILSDIGIASFNVYGQRGMASRAVMLYVIPLIVASAVLNRAAVYATAALCAVAYTVTAVSYFVFNFNEGYKIELYGEVGFYSCLLFILAALLCLQSKNKTR